MLYPSRRLLLVFSCLVFCFCASVHAQQFAPNEVTVSSNLQTMGVQSCVPIGTGPTCSIQESHTYSLSTLALTYTRNLSPSLGLVATVTPTSPFLYPNSPEAGREALAMGGVRTGWRGRHVDLFGQVLAGAASFSCDQWSNYGANGYTNCKRQSHFTLEYGAVAEYHLNRRYSIHADLGNLQLMRFDNISLRYSDGSAEIYMPGHVIQHLDARVGLTRSFGSLREARSEPVPQKQNWDAGILFALQPRNQPGFEYLNTYPSWGLWSSYNFSQHVSWDSALLHSGRNPGMETIDYQSGGRAFEALSGVKVGIRRDHMGYFLKARPGIITFGETERGAYATLNGGIRFDNGMFTNFVFDTGAVYEVYPSRHSILRFEAGDAHIFYLSKNNVTLGVKSTIHGYNAPTPFIGFGAGIRF